METMGVENPYYRRSIKQTSYAKRACWYYPTTNTEDTDMEDVEYCVDVYDIYAEGSFWHDKTGYFDNKEEAIEYMNYYNNDRDDYFAKLRIEDNT
jgi:hypothetical protein